jgi:hypothetical protein
MTSLTPSGCAGRKRVRPPGWLAGSFLRHCSSEIASFIADSSHHFLAVSSFRGASRRMPKPAAILDALIFNGYGGL